MKRHRIVDGDRDALVLQMRHEPVALPAGRPDRILSEDRQHVVGHGGRLDGTGEPLPVAPCDRLARLDLVGKDRQLFQEDTGLYRIHASGHADAHIVVLVRALAVEEQRAHHLGEFVVLREHRAAVAVAAERLGREEAGRRGVPAGAGPPASVAGAEALGGIRQKPEPLRFGHRFERVVVGRQTEQVDGDDPGGHVAGRARLADRRLERTGVDVETVLQHVDEIDRRPEPGYHLGRRDEGEGRAEHGVARLDALGHEDERQRIGSAGDGDRVPRAAEAGQLRLQLADLRTHDVLPVVEGARDRGIDAVANALLLPGEVDEADGGFGRLGHDGKILLQVE